MCLVMLVDMFYYVESNLQDKSCRRYFYMELALARFLVMHYDNIDDSYRFRIALFRYGCFSPHRLFSNN